GVQHAAAVEQEYRGIEARGRLQLRGLSRLDVHIEQVDWRERARRPFDAVQLTRNHARIAALGKVHLWNLVLQQGLILRRRHLQLAWKIHPELDHFERAAGAREL